MLPKRPELPFWISLAATALLTLVVPAVRPADEGRRRKRPVDNKPPFGVGHDKPPGERGAVMADTVGARQVERQRDVIALPERLPEASGFQLSSRLRRSAASRRDTH